MSAGIDDLRGAERYCLVRLADEHGMTVGLGEERDRTQRCSAFEIELPCCVDEAHRGLAAIDDGYALKLLRHTPPDRQIVTAIKPGSSGRDGFQRHGSLKRF